MIVPFLSIHADMMEPAPEFEGMDVFGMVPQLERGIGFSLFAGHGRPVCCAGVIPIENGRYLAAALFAVGAGAYLRTIVRHVRRFLELFDAPRVEAISFCDCLSSARFLRMVGFELEAPRMRKFASGRDCALFARVR